MSEPQRTPMKTKLVAQLGDWEGEAAFDQVRIFKRGKQTLVVELTDGNGNVAEVSLPSAGVKKLLNWRMLMNL